MKDEKELAKLINLKALEKLRDGNKFDTGQIWDAIGGLDALCGSYYGEGGLREQLFQLYKIADEVINNEDYSSLNDEETKIYRLADEISFELSAASEHVEKLESAVRDLEELYPLEDEFDDEDED